MLRGFFLGGKYQFPVRQGRADQGRCARPDMRGGPVSRILSTPGRDPRLDGHSSKDGVATAPLAANPDRKAKTCPCAVPIWHCSRWGLPCRDCCQPRGGPLPHRFTLTTRDRLRSLDAVSFLWRFPLGYPSRALPGTVVLWSPDFPPDAASLTSRPAAIRPSAPAPTMRPRGPGQRQTAQRCRPARPCQQAPAALAPPARHRPRACRGASADAVPSEPRHP